MLRVGLLAIAVLINLVVFWGLHLAVGGSALPLPERLITTELAILFIVQVLTTTAFLNDLLAHRRLPGFTELPLKEDMSDDAIPMIDKLKGMYPFILIITSVAALFVLAR